MAKLRKHVPPPGWKNPLAQQQPLTSVRWIAAAGVATVLFALLCVYVTFCLLFWQGQWQLVFQPSRNVAVTPAAVGLPYDEVSFDTTETGVTLLHGWWIPASSATTRTVLFLHGGSGSLADTVPRLQTLHSIGLNVFAFDYRGFGQSAPIHPSERTTYEDADAAWHYLTETRHIQASGILLDGAGLGAAIAAETARRYAGAPALILEDPLPPVLDTLRSDPRIRLLPVGLLFHDRFDPAKTLAMLATPKLFLYSPAAGPALYYERAAEPKQQATEANAADATADFAKQHLSGQ